MQTVLFIGSDILHMKRQKEREVEDEQAHPGRRPASPRQHEVLMDLIDWQEHQEVQAELSAD